ncbi:MAG: adenosine kinase [Verrucomicrobia bacterium]|nr:adenosine kinase [Verrucomicrobiota bacterium]MDA1065612.1 adenosine kinase [Verrucomicrobiota bacterium]
MNKDTFQNKVIGMGSPVVDLLAHVSDEFVLSVAGEKGGMVLVDTLTMDDLLAKLPVKPVLAPGGSTGNTVLGLAELGNPAAMLGKIGNCEIGTFYRNGLMGRGGDGSRFKVGTIANGRCLSLVTPDSERTMRTDLGAAMTLDPEEISVHDFQGYHHAHIEGYILFNRDLMYKALDSAKAAGCTISLDLASFEVVHATKDIMADIIKNYVDVIFSNEEEAAAFTGLGQDYTAMVRYLAQLAEIAVVKLGKNGSLIAQGNEVFSVAACPVARAVDTTGAGDLWACGFLYGWLNGRDLKRSGEYGSILGAEAVQVMGASIPESRWQVIREQFLPKNKS